MRRILLIATASLGVAVPRAHAQPANDKAGGKPAGAKADDKGEIQARALFAEANKRLESGDTAGAAELYEEAFRRFPDNPKILLNLGTAYVRLKRNAAAANAYQSYLDHAKADKTKVATVKKTLAELDRKVAILQVELAEPGARVRLDGEELGQAPQKISRRVEVGPHLVAAEKEGFTPSQATVTVAVAETRSIQLRLVPRPVAPPPPPEAPARVATTAPLQGDLGDARGELRQHAEISHGGHAGLFARVDVDGNDLGGAAVAVGASYGVASSVELEAAVLAGSNFGAWGGATLYLGRGAWKPLITVGAPVYFLDSGALFGLHGAVGAEWNMSPHVGVVVAAGVQYYVDPPMGIVDVAFVPSVAFNYRR